MYTHITTLYVSSQKCNVASAMSRVEVSASLRRCLCRCRISGQHERRSVDEYNLSGDHHHTAVVVTTAQYCYCRRSSHADITNESTTTRLVDHLSVTPAQRVALRRFQNHGTPFT